MELVDYYTVKEVANLLFLEPATVTRWCRDGRITNVLIAKGKPGNVGLIHYQIRKDFMINAELFFHLPRNLLIHNPDRIFGKVQKK